MSLGADLKENTDSFREDRDGFVDCAHFSLGTLLTLFPCHSSLFAFMLECCKGLLILCFVCLRLAKFSLRCVELLCFLTNCGLRNTNLVLSNLDTHLELH